MPSNAENKHHPRQDGDEKERFNLLELKFGGSPPPKRSVCRAAAPQIFASMGFGFMVASVASICVMPTQVVDDLHKRNGSYTNETEFELSETQVSWYGSLSYMVQPIASICSGFTQNIFGRRRMMLAATIPLFASWIVLHFADNVVSLYATQIIFGLSIGFMEAPSMSYLGEAIEPRFRGTLSSLAEFLYIAGTVYLNLIGVFFHWKTLSLLAAILPLITFFIVLTLPESPTWFIVKGRLDEAEEALQWLRGWVTSEEVEEEVRMTAKMITENPYSGARIIDGEYTKVKNTPSQVALFRQARVWKPVLLICIFFCAGNAGSLIGMRPMFTNIFEDLHTPIPPKQVLVLSSAMNAIGCIVCVLTVHKTGKRFISLASLLLCTATCLALAAYLWTKADFPWLATVFFSINFFAAGLGILTMPWALVSECFSLEARGLSAGICAAGAYVTYSIFTKSYFALHHLLSLPGVFVVYGLISLAGAAYLYFLMPETEGKELSDIEKDFA
ncbi:transporter [Nesidiocoris tenuis]|uniref:Transporter n=1 Tax=Nesidiocoris tenuis TaxID=355587 RepID=A0ABN7BC73_9HEMI|nr:transporter [Nesidiocoris tenuis]